MQILVRVGHATTPPTPNTCNVSSTTTNRRGRTPSSSDPIRSTILGEAGLANESLSSAASRSTMKRFTPRRRISTGAAAFSGPASGTVPTTRRELGSIVTRSIPRICHQTPSSTSSGPCVRPTWWVTRSSNRGGRARSPPTVDGAEAQPPGATVKKATAARISSRLNPHLIIRSAYHLEGCIWEPTRMTNRLHQLEKLLAVDPHDAECLYFIAMEHAGAGDAEQALAFFDRALNEDPGFCYAYFHKARTLEAMGDAGAAREVLTDGLARAVAAGDAKAREEISSFLDSLG